MFKPVDNRQNFPQLEEEVLQFWKENNSFRKSIDIRAHAEEFVFYDGPPFATGLPHYGHILAGTIKDVIPRYKTMRGFKVERKFGWDCHGLPVENLIEKELGLEDKQAILKFGIDNFNEACRNSVLRYTAEWEQVVSRMGRWVDFQDDYKTMDPEFMESIWWVFKQLWNKNLVYQGLKPMHVCPRCVTPLSNFEVNQGYKDLTDLSVTAKFKLKANADSGVRKAKSDDEKQKVYEFLKKMWKEEFDLDIESRRDEFFTCSDLFFIEQDNVLVSAIQVIANEGKYHIGRVGTINNERDRGYGSSLLRFVLNELQAQGIQEISLTADANAIGFYQKFGFFETEADDLNREFIERQRTLGRIVVPMKKEFNDQIGRNGQLTVPTDSPVYFLAWTTTPWTLPGNMLLAVNPEVEYVQVSIKPKRDFEIIKATSQEQIESAIDFIIEHQYNRYGIENTRKAILNEDENFEVFYFIAQKKERIVGVTSAKIWKDKERKVSVHFWVVDENERGQGIGKALLEKIEDIAREKKESIIFAAARPVSVPMYQACGFTRISNMDEIPFNGMMLVPHEKRVNLLDSLETFIVAKDLVSQIFGKQEVEIIKTVKGSELAGLEYEPLFPYYQDKSPFKVVCADFVTTDSGTGIVHIAPAFGEDDLNVGKQENLQAIQHVGMDGMFEMGLVESIQKEFPEFKAMPVKQAGQNKNRLFDEQMVKFLESKDKVFSKKMMAHSYPTCWRCETPLLNYATKSWFVKVEQLKDRLLANNQKIHWVPDHLKNGRFGKWLEGARDWAVSRNRYWGTPLPVWENSVNGKQICVGSVEELKNISGVELKDLHKHFADKIEFTVAGEEGVYKRVEEVFDCWFESGSMPYAQRHFPFEETIVLNNDFYISRHGQAEHNVANISSCTEESACLYPLTELGRNQLVQEAQSFSEKFDFIISSPLLRCKQTAEIYQKYCGGELVVDDRLIEHHVGVFDNKDFCNWVDFKNQNDPWTNAVEGGETWQQVLDRMFSALNEYNEKFSGKRILFVSHGLPTEVLLAHVRGGKKQKEDPCVPKGKIFKLENIKFPADFIAEGLDQTRGWFYTLHVLGTAIFDKPAFSNVITNGIVLAEDGQKMSKSKKNYPDPSLIFHNYGADAMRFYLMNSPVAQADDLRFSERGVSEVVRTVLLPLWNSYSFLVTYANADGWEPESRVSSLENGENQNTPNSVLSSPNPLDQWIVSELEILRKKYFEAMELYHLNKAADLFPKFLDNLTNWYIRRSRRRFWTKTGEGDEQDKNAAYETLYFVLLEVIQLLAPFCPFVTESIYQNLALRTENGELRTEKNPKTLNSDLVTPNSIHHVLLKNVNESVINEGLSARVDAMQNIISLGLQLRKNVKMKVRQPLVSAEIASAVSYNFSQDDLETIQEELNVKSLHFLSNPEELAELQVKPNAKLLGPKFGAKVQEIIREAKSGNFEKTETGYIVCGETLTFEEIEMAYIGKEGREVASGNGVVLAFDLELTQELINEGKARDLVRAIQDMRKQAAYEVSDRIFVEISGADEVLESFGDYILAETLGEFSVVSSPDQESEIEGVLVKVKRK